MNYIISNAIRELATKARSEGYRQTYLACNSFMRVMVEGFLLETADTSVVVGEYIERPVIHRDVLFAGTFTFHGIQFDVLETRINHITLESTVPTGQLALLAETPKVDESLIAGVSPLELAYFSLSVEPE